jgi:hypothetical protein
MTDFTQDFKNDNRMKKVALGIDTIYFIEQTKLGAYLVEQANNRRIVALEELAEADPTNQELIRTLQWQSRIPDLFLSWLDEAIANGRTEEINIRIEDANNVAF